MAIPAGAVLLRVSGNLVGGETWSCGLWFYGNGAATSMQAAVNSIAVGGGNLVGPAFGFYLAGGEGISQLAAYRYANGGDTATDVGVRAVSIVGSGTRTMPDQVCLVNSLRSDNATRRGRGRVFVPVGAVPSGDLTAGQLTNTAAGQQASRMATFINDAQSQFGDAAIVSRTAGAFYLMTRVEVDTRFDIQRRRAAQQSIGGRASSPVT